MRKVKINIRETNRKNKVYQKFPMGVRRIYIYIYIYIYLLLFFYFTPASDVFQTLSKEAGTNFFFSYGPRAFCAN